MLETQRAIILRQVARALHHAVDVPKVGVVGDPYPGPRCLGRRLRRDVVHQIPQTAVEHRRVRGVLGVDQTVGAVVSELGEEVTVGVAEEAVVKADGGGGAEGAAGGSGSGGAVEAGGALAGGGVEAALGEAVGRGRGGGGVGDGAGEAAGGGGEVGEEGGQVGGEGAGDGVVGVAAVREDGFILGIGFGGIQCCYKQH